MVLPGHRTAEAARLYVKRTEAQRASAARKRRAGVEVMRSNTRATTTDAPKRQERNKP
jgi:hypothetical protein